jgi:hypothetical protein
MCSTGSYTEHFAVVELRFKSVIQQTHGATAWRYDLYVEGQKEPVAIGFVVGTKADVEARILEAQEFAVDNWNNQSDRPIVKRAPKS